MQVSCEALPLLPRQAPVTPGWQKQTSMVLKRPQVLLTTLALMLCLAFPAAAQQPEPAQTPKPTQSLERIGLPPSVSLVVFPGYGVAPLTVGYFADIDDPLGEDVVSYYWNFGDGNVSTLPPPLFVTNTYKNPGTYLVTLRVVTADGRAATAVAGVTVRTNPERQ
jgi:hypothetical protein